MSTKTPVGSSQLLTREETKTDAQSKSTGIVNIRLTQAQYKDVIFFSSYNKILRKTPDTASGVIAEAVSRYLAALNFKLDYGMIRNEPDQSYVQKLKQLQSTESSSKGIPKSYSLPKSMIEDLTTIAAFNKYHNLKPDGTVEIAKDALAYYFSNIKEDFRPLN